MTTAHAWAGPKADE